MFFFRGGGGGGDKLVFDVGEIPGLSLPINETLVCVDSPIFFCGFFCSFFVCCWLRWILPGYTGGGGGGGVHLEKKKKKKKN